MKEARRTLPIFQSDQNPQGNSHRKETNFTKKMHCLNLKVVADFNALMLPSRLSSSTVKDCGLRLNRIIACSTSGQGSGPIAGSSQRFVSRTETYALLKQQLDVAAKAEDYKEAARLRDSLKLFEEEEPVLRLRRLLKDSIADERFEDAAKYRDELKEIAPHFLLKCSSDSTTFGIRVQVRSVYVEGRSQPSKGLYFFAYRIRITNYSDRPVHLLTRHWIISDANGKTENVHGVGVIGEQPVLLPNTSFEYSSACPLSTPSGRMEGGFEMKHIDNVDTPNFNVIIAPFSVSTFGDDTDAI